LPLFLAAAYFCVSLIAMSTGIAMWTGTSEDAAIPLWTVLCWAAQPFLAVVGGVASFHAVGRRIGGLAE
jgi:Ni,Fe-hydrogenase I cytochrome b subunit